MTEAARPRHAGRGYNFGAGPAMLPDAVMEELREELLDYRGTGQSVMEMGHRTPAFEAIATEAESGLRALMGIPNDYAVLFLQGGAAMQFGMVPLNLAPGGSADYVITGHWSKRACQEAQRLIRVNVAADAQDSGYTGIPAPAGWRLGSNVAYLHYTVNETIGGVEFQWLPETTAPLVADMTSMILSRPVDVNRYGLIYASAQKNLGIAGLTVVIARRELLKAPPAGLPGMLDYRAHDQAHSMQNTPPTYAWYVCGKVLKWVVREGGVHEMARRNRRKAELLYARLDQGDFYRSPVQHADRSWMNVPFTLADKTLEPGFLREAEAAGLLNLAGHRTAGGMRASLYNAMPEEGVHALVEFMNDFERRHG